MGAALGERTARAPLVPTLQRGNEDLRSSIIIVIATDAPLLPHQLKALAKRASLGVGRVGGLGEVSSGDIFIAFSTANPDLQAHKEPTVQVTAVASARALNGLYGATLQATEEAIVNALVAAQTMTGADDHKVEALPHDRLKEILKKYGRLLEPKRN